MGIDLCDDPLLDAVSAAYASSEPAPTRALIKRRSAVAIRVS